MNTGLTETTVILETQYLPPISTFVMLRSFSTVVIDDTERFRKSTWRNRCKISGANGNMLLTVPVTGGRSVKKVSSEITIDNRHDWKRIHRGSIFSAYGRSTYFQFYEQKFARIYENKFQRLIDLNSGLLQLCFDILKWNRTIEFKSNQSSVSISKIYTGIPPVSDLKLPPYHQVFDSRHGFASDLSIIDLIFNLGPDAAGYLQHV